MFMKNSVEEQVQQAIKENPALPERFVREVVIACNEIKNIEVLHRRLRKIGWDSFFRDEGGETLEFIIFGELTIEVNLWIDALQHFGNEKMAKKWFQRPLDALSETTPVDYCSHEPNGHRRVHFLLQGEKDKKTRYHENARKRLKPGEFMVDAGLWLDAVEFFGSTDETIDWLLKPQQELGGVSAYKHCTNEVYGSQDVEKLLNKLKQEKGKH